MAITYYAEIVLKDPQKKYRVGVPVEYNIRVFVDNDGTEDQLGAKGVVAFGLGRKFARVSVSPLPDCDIGDVQKRNEDDSNDNDKDVFYVGITPRTSGTYTPSFIIQVYEEDLNPFGQNKLATNDAADLQANPGLKTLEIKVPRQNVNSIISVSPGGQNTYQSVTIPEIVATKQKVSPKMPEPLFSFNPASTLNLAPEAMEGFKWAECTQSWLIPYKTPRWVNKQGQIRTHVSMNPIAVFETQKDGYHKQWNYTIWGITHEIAKANQDKNINQLKAAGHLKVVWTSASFDWAITDSTFSSVGRTAQNKYSNKDVAKDKFKALTKDNCREEPPSGGATGDPEDEERNVQVTGIRFNPPPHSTTRSFSPIADRKGFY